MYGAWRIVNYKHVKGNRETIESLTNQEAKPMLCLNEQDILDAAARDEIMDAVESAMRLYESRDFEMPQRLHVDYGGNTLLLMPCFTTRSFATKLVSLFPENPKKNLPVLMGVVILNDGETGKPKAMFNGAALTALRTGAVGGVGIRHLASRDVTTLGVIGAGVQGFYQSLFACTARPFSEICILDRFPEKADRLAEKLSASLTGVKAYPFDSTEKLLSRSDVVITATNSQKPVLPDNPQLLSGKHYVGIGSYKPEMRE
jgi:ornithine cyclodeaminase